MRTHARWLGLASAWIVVVMVGCGGARGAQPSERTTTPTVRTDRPILQASPFTRALDRDRFVAPLGRDHVLVGRVWSPSRSALVEPEDVARDVARARFVLLGEKHDDPDHQRLHAAWIETIAAAERRPACVLEMLDTDRQSAIDAALANDATRADPDALANAIDWGSGGWPWASYRPVVAAVLAARLDLRGGNYPRARTRALVQGGESQLAPAERTRLGIDRALPADQQAELVREMADSHCGMLPESMFAPMSLMQRARDGEMAAAMASAGDRGAVLVAGAGHVRRDRGVPWVLTHAHSVAADDVRAVAYVEVADGQDDPARYARAFGAGPLPFDYVVFTARATDEDPCAAMRARGTAPSVAPRTP